MPTQCEQALSALRDKVREQNEFIEAITTAAQQPAVVLEATDEALLLAVGGNRMQALPFKGAQVGSHVLVNPATMQISGLSPFTANLGTPCTVEGTLPDGRIEVLIAGDRRLVMRAQKLPKKIAAGSSALLDASNSVLMEVITPPKLEAPKHDNVSWDSIGGNERAKRELRDAVTLMRAGGKLYDAYGVRPPKGVLLYGPPGCGKTLLGRAVATELGSSAFTYVKAPELLNAYIGATEERIRTLFRSARTHKAHTGETSVIFIDEADAILQKRGSGVSSDMEKTIVPSFLTEMDGLTESAALVILATNRRDSLDEAVIREGRIDAQILIERPGEPEVQQIFEINLKKLPLSGWKLDGAVHYATQTLFATPAMAARVSGAMVTTVVDRAKRAAVRRDVTENRLSGITQADITAAIHEGA